MLEWQKKCELLNKNIKKKDEEINNLKKKHQG